MGGCEVAWEAPALYSTVSDSLAGYLEIFCGKAGAQESLQDHIKDFLNLINLLNWT